MRKRMRWTEQDLASRRRADAGKVRLATEPRPRTTIPLAGIVQRLKMGTRSYLAWLCYPHTKGMPAKRLAVRCKSVGPSGNRPELSFDRFRGLFHHSHHVLAARTGFFGRGTSRRPQKRRSSGTHGQTPRPAKSPSGPHSQPTTPLAPVRILQCFLPVDGRDRHALSYPQ